MEKNTQTNSVCYMFIKSHVRDCQPAHVKRDHIIILLLWKLRACLRRGMREREWQTMLTIPIRAGSISGRQAVDCFGEKRTRKHYISISPAFFYSRHRRPCRSDRPACRVADSHINRVRVHGTHAYRLCWCLIFRADCVCVCLCVLYGSILLFSSST